MCDDLSFINTTQNTFKPSEKNVSMSRMDEKKLRTWDLQRKCSSRNMRRKLIQKRFTGKTRECSKYLRYIAIEKNILSELNRCIFQMPLKYFKLVISKILFIMVLCSFTFYFKITLPPFPLPPPPPPPKKKLKFLPPPPPPAAKTSEIFNPPCPKLERGA